MTPKLQNPCSLKSVLKTAFKKVITTVLTLILILLIPIIFTLVTLTFGSFRYLLHKSSKWIRPDLSKMLTLRGSVLALDNLYTQPNSNIVIKLVLEGSMDINRLKQNVQQNILQLTFPNGEVKYPELKQYFTSWLGYYFWKDDPAFDLNRHVILQKVANSLSDFEIQDIFEQLVQKPWTRGKPLWEIILVPNYYPNFNEKEPHSVLFFNVHHSLCDGYSILRLLTEGLSENRRVPLNVKPTFVRRTWLKSTLFWVIFPFKSFYEMAHGIVETDYKPPFKPPENGLNDMKYSVGVTNKFPINQIKDIKNHFGVSFVSVVTTICTGALRDLMIIKGEKVPDTFACGTVLPLRGHSEKLRNIITLATLKFCTGEPDPVKRLMTSFKDYQRLKRSSLPILRGCLRPIVTCLPSPIMKRLIKNNPITSGISIFPAGLEHMYSDGGRCIDISAAGGLVHDSIGITFFAVSYVDEMRISVIANNTVIPREELDELVQLVEKHLDILNEEIIKDV